MAPRSLRPQLNQIRAWVRQGRTDAWIAHQLEVSVKDLRQFKRDHDLEALCVHLDYPLKHRRRWRSTNLLERSLGEVRRRTKVIGRFPGESSCLSLCWAVLDLVITHSNNVTFTDLEQLQLERIMRERVASTTTTTEVIAA